MASEKVLQRMERWLAKNGEAWEKYGQFYEGWTLEEVAELLEAVRAAS